MESLASVLPIFGALGAGVIAGKLGGRWFAPVAAKCMAPSVLILMFLVGAEAAPVLLTLSSLGSTLALASVVAGLATLGSAAPCFVLVRSSSRFPLDGAGTRPRAWLVRLIYECSMPIAMVAAGALATTLPGLGSYRIIAADAGYLFLLMLIGLVGIDLCTITFDRAAFSRRVFFVPLVVVAGSLCGGLAASVIMDQPVRVALALASGFGWFSMSGALVSNLAGSFYGTTALLADLIRELMAMVLLYAFGRSAPSVGIASGGAASMDSLLPVVRVTCHHSAIPLAIITGFVLTIMAPVMISMFLVGVSPV